MGLGPLPADRNSGAMTRNGKDIATRLVHTRGARLSPPTVNPPVERASTVLMADADGLYNGKPSYGRMGLAVHRELEAALCTLEGANHARLAANGLQACALAIAAVVSPGGHLLFTDCAYGPTARFCERRLPKMGVTAERFDPRIGGQISGLIRPDTHAIFVESPGSLTFEVSDLPAIAAAARARGVPVICDNTWSAGFFHKPLLCGADISVQALTKYVCGHSDVFGGAVMTRDKDLAERLEAASEDWGISLSPDDAYTALRGLRTLPARLRAHEAAALELAHWLAARPEVAEVRHPALPSHPDHEIWRRDFSGSSGLFGVVLEPVDKAALSRFLAALQLFGLGFSWGGYESLVIPCDQQLTRRKACWTRAKRGPLLRLHVGLEAPADLEADLDAAFTALRGEGCPSAS